MTQSTPLAASASLGGMTWCVGVAVIQVAVRAEAVAGLSRQASGEQAAGVR
jgi:hypothetical protein